jgi:hypothetical protein
MNFVKAYAHETLRRDQATPRARALFEIPSYAETIAKPVGRKMSRDGVPLPRLRPTPICAAGSGRYGVGMSVGGHRGSAANSAATEIGHEFFSS